MSNDISGVWGKVDMKSGNCMARKRHLDKKKGARFL